jgi:hypothetical protein
VETFFLPLLQLIAQVAQKRLPLLSHYLCLTLCNKVVGESDLLYTFLHTWPRDEHDTFEKTNVPVRHVTVCVPVCVRVCL